MRQAHPLCCLVLCPAVIPRRSLAIPHHAQSSALGARLTPYLLPHTPILKRQPGDFLRESSGYSLTNEYPRWIGIQFLSPILERHQDSRRFSCRKFFQTA